MKKVLLFTDSLGAGGAQRQLVGLSLLLKQKNYGVKVCTYHKLEFYKYFLDENSIPNEIIPSASNPFKRIFAVIKYFNREDPDWIIAFQEMPSLISCLAKIFCRSSHLIVSERNTTQSIGIKDYIRFFLYKYADYIVPNSYTQSSFLKNKFVWMIPKIRTITNFVDTEKFYPKKHVKHSITHIVVVGSLWPSKNPRGLVKACRLLKDLGVNVHICWYGLNDDVTDYHKETVNLLESLNVSDYLEFLPKTKQILEKYQNADFLCLPSLFEGTPNVICEALACGIPIICSDVCDNNLYVTEDYNGFLFDPLDPNSIAKSVIKAVSMSEQKYGEFCVRCRKVAEEKLSKESFVLKYEQILKR